VKGGARGGLTYEKAFFSQVSSALFALWSRRGNTCLLWNGLLIASLRSRGSPPHCGILKPLREYRSDVGRPTQLFQFVAKRFERLKDKGIVFPF
jgi:hypothetical protein